MSYWQFAPYVSVGERKSKAMRKLKELQKKDPGISPVIIEGSTIAKSWWGKSWNKNLEKYADYSNRIGRGRSYVRHGSVIDLRIGKGVVNALVQGSNSAPYEITIKIKKINKKTWEKIIFEADGKLDSLHELLSGSIPKPLAEIFTEKGSGLFPSPKEIEFDCDCPDGAYMCKHIAAVLYGIGARLDNDSNLFFTLRNVNVENLVTKIVKGKTKQLLEKADKKSARVIDDADLSSVFGIELDEGTVPKKRITSKAKVTTKKKTSIKAKPKVITKRITKNRAVKETESKSVKTTVKNRKSVKVDTGKETDKKTVKKTAAGKDTKITAKSKKTASASTEKTTEQKAEKKTVAKVTKTIAKDKKRVKSEKTIKKTKVTKPTKKKAVR